MYEIHINDSKIFLIKSALKDHYRLDKDVLTFKYNGKTKYILNYIDKAEKSKQAINIVIHHSNLTELKNDFFSLFKIIKAGGGLVLNKEAQILLIFRRGSWDLPKGKREKGEKRKQTALREVREETGITDLSIIHALPDTYHVYRTAKERILKLSYWYLMETEDFNLIPQTEEDIEVAKWVDINEVKKEKFTPMYGNITRLIGHFLSSFSDLKSTIDNFRKLEPTGSDSR